MTMNETIRKAGRPKKDQAPLLPMPRRATCRITVHDEECIKYIREHRDSLSENDALRASIRFTKYAVGLMETTGIYTKIGNEFVKLEFPTL
jgi:hypothetical protein